jgi:hypothetical protein
MRGDPRYDDVVEAEAAINATDGFDYNNRAEYDERVRVVRIHRELYEDLMWRSATTPEELLAAQLASTASMRRFEPGRPVTEDWWATVLWPWGDARGLLKAKGRTYDEARLRLRDKLVKSAREIAGHEE